MECYLVVYLSPTYKTLATAKLGRHSRPYINVYQKFFDKYLAKFNVDV